MRELCILLWCDFEPAFNGWGDWGRRDFWRSTFELGNPQKSLEKAKEMGLLLDKYSAKMNWCLFYCEPFVENTLDPQYPLGWLDYVKDFIDRRRKRGDLVSIHLHWVVWSEEKGRWIRNKPPTEETFLRTLRKGLRVFRERGWDGKIVRTGWNTLTTSSGGELVKYYKDFGIIGLCGVQKREKEYFWHEKYNNFLLIPFDADTQNNWAGTMESKWREGLKRAFKRSCNNGFAVFSWYCHTFEVKLKEFELMLQTIKEIGKKFNIHLRFVNAQEFYDYLIEKEELIKYRKGRIRLQSQVDKMEKKFEKEDPWGYRVSNYEIKKYEQQISLLKDKRYQKALEIGCAEGAFTERLAKICDSVTGLDVSKKALERAERYLKELENVNLVNGNIVDVNFSEKFDLIIVSEVIYYIPTELLERTIQKICALMERGGRLLLVNRYVGRETLRYREMFGDKNGLKIERELWGEGVKGGVKKNYLMTLFRKM
jgi:protein-L-isoaspartate O-methyltransferase